MKVLYNIGDIVHLRKSRRSEFLERAYGDSLGVVVDINTYSKSPPDYLIKFEVEVGDEMYERFSWVDQWYIELFTSIEEDIRPELLDSLF